MNITITKDELKEIIRLFIIGTTYENKIINEKSLFRENENERIIDNINLLVKLKKIAYENKIENFEELNLDNNENFIEELINKRKRTYTSKYWNFYKI